MVDVSDRRILQRQKQNESKNMKSSDYKVAGRYSYDEFDDLVRRLQRKAQEQERKHGPVDLAKLARQLRALDRDEEKNIKEQPETATDPTQQATSPTTQDTATTQQATNPTQQVTSQSGSAEQLKQKQAQAVDTSTAKNVASSLTAVLPAGTNTNALAQGIINANDGKPLNPDQQKAMNAVQPLLLKAAETPATAGALKTALQNAGILAKQGK
jgi:hypothetical protein